MDIEVPDTSNSARFVIVNEELIEEYLAEAQGLLKGLVEKFSFELTLDYINERIRSGDLTMVAIVDDAEIRYMALTNVITFPTGNSILNVPYSMGRDPYKYVERIMNGVMIVAKAANCKKVVGKGVRPGVAKFLKNYGWKIHRPSMIIEVA